MRRSVSRSTTPLAVVLQAASLLVVVGGVAGVLVYDVVQQRSAARQAELSASAQLDVGPADHVHQH